MANTKYGKYITTECVKPNKKREGSFITSTRDLESFGGGELSIDCIFIQEPHLMISQPHVHEFPQYLSFFSSNPDDPREFDAEIELSLGEEGEQHIITSPTSVYVPAGLYHGPINFARVTKPFLFLDIAVTGKYSRVGDTPD